MTGLNQIITSFSAEEKQQFIHYLQKKNKRNDAKNVQLFKLLSEGNQDINSISQKIYRCQNNDAPLCIEKAVVSFSNRFYRQSSVTGRKFHRYGSF